MCFNARHNYSSGVWWAKWPEVSLGMWFFNHSSAADFTERYPRGTVWNRQAKVKVTWKTNSNTIWISRDGGNYVDRECNKWRRDLVRLQLKHIVAYYSQNTIPLMLNCSFIARKEQLHWILWTSPHFFWLFIYFKFYIYYHMQYSTTAYFNVKLHTLWCSTNMKWLYWINHFTNKLIYTNTITLGHRGV